MTPIQERELALAALAGERDARCMSCALPREACAGLAWFSAGLAFLLAGHMLSARTAFQLACATPGPVVERWVPTDCCDGPPAFAPASLLPFR